MNGADHLDRTQRLGRVRTAGRAWAVVGAVMQSKPPRHTLGRMTGPDHAPAIRPPPTDASARGSPCDRSAPQAIAVPEVEGRNRVSNNHVPRATVEDQTRQTLHRIAQHREPGTGIADDCG